MKKKKIIKKLKEFFNSSNPIIIALIIIIVVLISYTSYLMKSNKIFIFNGKSEYVSINNGVVSLNYDINLFEGSDIDYIKDKDVTVTYYKIGYYVKDNDNLVPITVIEDTDEEGFSLKALVEGISAFNLNELNKNNKHITKENKKLFQNGLYFIIEAVDKKENNITDITTLEITKISK